MKQPAIAGYAHSPITLAGNYALAHTGRDDLIVIVASALVARTGVRQEDVEALVLGCAFPETEQEVNLARLVVLDIGHEIAGGRWALWTSRSRLAPELGFQIA